MTNGCRAAPSRAVGWKYVHSDSCSNFHSEVTAVSQTLSQQRRLALLYV